MVAMASLRAFFTELGFADVRTLLQSGNVVFRARAQSTAKLEAKLEKAAAETLDLDTRFFVRTHDELAAIVQANPFPEWAKRDPAHLHVAFLPSAVAADAVTRLQKAIAGPELVAGGGREVYLVYPEGAGRSRLTVALIEKHLGVPFTARNWNQPVSRIARHATPAITPTVTSVIWLELCIASKSR